MSRDGRLLQAVLRNDFRAFVEKVFLTLTPGQTYIRSWHIDAIAYQLERVRRGEIKRLIINVPPRHGKSELCELLWRSCQEALQRLPRRTRLSLVSIDFSCNESWSLQEQ